MDVSNLFIQSTSSGCLLMDVSNLFIQSTSSGCLLMDVSNFCFVIQS